jgi:phage/plasmid-like protein (TIGR03299 family)|tara:strand:- start:104 stop:1048 length:945 start_codon:yes stop_codon:yes gene_type:complete
MSHEIEMVNGVAQMAYAGDLPWHGLGQQVSDDITTDGMMKAAGLDWSVTKQPMYYMDDLGEMGEVPGKSALVRSSDNKVMDIVGQDWNPVQNAEAFEFFREFVDTGDMQMHTAGSLKDGKMVWALAKVNDGFTIKTAQGEDSVESYLLFSNPHQYGKSIDVRFTPIRVVCNNTLTLSLNQNVDQYVRMGHQRPFNAEDAMATLGMAHKKLETYKEAAEYLCQKSYTTDDMLNYFNQVFPSASDRDSNKSREAQEVMHTQAGAALGEGTFWQLFNTVTYMTDHTLGRNSDTRLQSAWYGQNQNVKKKALELAVNM